MERARVWSQRILVSINIAKLNHVVYLLIDPRYQHIITGSRSPEPVEAQGGIIADDMGLGKTLVTISSIASSLDRATAFASENVKSPDDSFSLTRSKATLILAPSSCKTFLFTQRLLTALTPASADR